MCNSHACMYSTVHVKTNTEINMGGNLFARPIYRTGVLELRSILILLASCQQICMIYTITVRTVKNS
jgi:hypothetical protein